MSSCGNLVKRMMIGPMGSLAMVCRQILNTQQGMCVMKTHGKKDSGTGMVSSIRR
jgi:hypothetical protein